MRSLRSRQGSFCSTRTKQVQLTCSASAQTFSSLFICQERAANCLYCLAYVQNSLFDVIMELFMPVSGLVDNASFASEFPAASNARVPRG